MLTGLLSVNDALARLVEVPFGPAAATAVSVALHHAATMVTTAQGKAARTELVDRVDNADQAHTGSHLSRQRVRRAS